MEDGDIEDITPSLIAFLVLMRTGMASRIGASPLVDSGSDSLEAWVVYSWSKGGCPKLALVGREEDNSHMLKKKKYLDI